MSYQIEVSRQRLSQVEVTVLNISTREDGPNRRGQRDVG